MRDVPHLICAIYLPHAEDFIAEIPDSDERKPVRLFNKSNQAPPPHWLFPNMAFTYRPYKPPLPPPPPPSTSETGFVPFDLPESVEELAEELFKQESLLAFTHQQIASGKGDAQKDAFIWEVSFCSTILHPTFHCSCSIWSHS